MIPRSSILGVLNEFRERSPDLIADLEVALNKLPDTDDADLAPLLVTEDAGNFFLELEGVCPNLDKWVRNNLSAGETLDDAMSQFQNMFQNLKGRHFNRLVYEMNKLPSNSPFVQLNILIRQVMHWAYAEVEIGAEPRPQNPLLQMIGAS